MAYDTHQVTSTLLSLLLFLSFIVSISLFFLFPFFSFQLLLLLFTVPFVVVMVRSLRYLFDSGHDPVASEAAAD